MWFQDLWTYDFRRTEMCIIPYATQMGEISFCAYNTGVGWRYIVEQMHQTATVAEWYKEHGKHAVYANPRKPVPLAPLAQPIALTIPKDGVLVPVVFLKGATHQSVGRVVPISPVPRRSARASRRNCPGQTLVADSARDTTVVKAPFMILARSKQRPSAVRRWLPCAVVFLALSWTTTSFSQRQETLRNEDIVAMNSARLGADAIILKIETSVCQFDLSTKALVTLKAAGVPDVVITAMLKVGAPAAHYPPRRTRWLRFPLPRLQALMP